MCNACDQLTVHPFVDEPGSSGEGAVIFKNAGTLACFDFYIKINKSSDWEPNFWHLHNGVPGTNGPGPFNFNSLRDGYEASGCVPFVQADVNDILLNQGEYYFDFYGAGSTAIPGSNIFKVLCCPRLNAKKATYEV